MGRGKSPPLHKVEFKWGGDMGGNFHTGESLIQLGEPGEGKVCWTCKNFHSR